MLYCASIHLYRYYSTVPAIPLTHCNPANQMFCASNAHNNTGLVCLRFPPAADDPLFFDYRSYVYYGQFRSICKYIECIVLYIPSWHYSGCTVCCVWSIYTWTVEFHDVFCYWWTQYCCASTVLFVPCPFCGCIITGISLFYDCMNIIFTIQ